MAPREEVFLPFDCPRAHPPPLTAVRGAVIASSIKALRKHELYDAYVQHLDPAHRDRVLGLSVSAWAPIAIAVAHYRACDALALDRATIEEIGGETGLSINQTVVSILVKLSREAGATPWNALARSNTLMARSWQGSRCGVFKLGPKEARFEWIGQPLAEIPYIRVGFAGFVRSIMMLFSTKAFVRELPAYCSATTLGYRCSWV
jgi:hypothetical protein